MLNIIVLALYSPKTKQYFLLLYTTTRLAEVVDLIIVVAGSNSRAASANDMAIKIATACKVYSKWAKQSFVRSRFRMLRILIKYTTTHSVTQRHHETKYTMHLH